MTQTHTTENDEYSYCIDCQKVRAFKVEGDYICASCSNKRYFEDLSAGRMVEIKIKKSDYKQGTIEQIYAILATNKLQ